MMRGRMSGSPKGGSVLIRLADQVSCKRWAKPGRGTIIVNPYR